MEERLPILPQVPPDARRAIPQGLPILAVFAVALTLWKPTEWYAIAAAVPAALLAASVPARNRVRWIRAAGAATVTTLALRHLLVVDQAWGGAMIALTAGILLWLSLDPKRSDPAVPLSIALGVFLAGTVGLEQRLFNIWPLSWLSIGVTVICFLLFGRLAEHRGSPWSYRGAGVVALVLGEAFLALLFWPTTPAVGGAVLALLAVSAISIFDTGTVRSTRLGLLVALTVLLLITARWN